MAVSAVLALILPTSEAIAALRHGHPGVVTFRIARSRHRTLRFRNGQAAGSTPEARNCIGGLTQPGMIGRVNQVTKQKPGARGCLRSHPRGLAAVNSPLNFPCCAPPDRHATHVTGVCLRLLAYRCAAWHRWLHHPCLQLRTNQCVIRAVRGGGRCDLGRRLRSGLKYPHAQKIWLTCITNQLAAS